MPANTENAGWNGCYDRSSTFMLEQTVTAGKWTSQMGWLVLVTVVRVGLKRKA